MHSCICGPPVQAGPCERKSPRTVLYVPNRTSYRIFHRTSPATTSNHVSKHAHSIHICTYVTHNHMPKHISRDSSLVILTPGGVPVCPSCSSSASPVSILHVVPEKQSWTSGHPLSTCTHASVRAHKHTYMSVCGAERRPRPLQQPAVPQVSERRRAWCTQRACAQVRVSAPWSRVPACMARACVRNHARMRSCV